MRCKSCQYRLWNIKTRECPECGLPFRPREYEFVVNSVRFCCPHCDQAYYGTGVNGRLVPEQFDCISCGQHIAMDAMILRPAEGATEEQTKVDRMPWLERKERGAIKAWLVTVGRAHVDAPRLMRSVPEGSATGPALVYAILTTCVFVFVGLALPILLIGLGMLVFGRGGDPTEPVIFGLISWGVVAGALLVLLAMWGVATHGLLMITGGTKYSLGRTFQALCYSCGAAALMAVPILGIHPFIFIPLTWWVVSGILMVAEGQGVNAGRAAFATLAFPTVVVLLALAGFGVLMVWGVSQANLATATVVTQKTETQAIASAVRAYAQDNDGRGPVHAIQLVEESDFGASNFKASHTFTAETQIPLAYTTLNTFMHLRSNRKQQAIDAAVGAVPQGMIAHRLGDFVFTYHGIDLDNADPALWIVILSPDPAQARLGNMSPFVTVGLADGTTRKFSGDFRIRLAAQNELRARYNLPPLPDPATVTHEKPAVAGSDG